MESMVHGLLASFNRTMPASRLDLTGRGETPLSFRVALQGQARNPGTRAKPLISRGQCSGIPGSRAKPTPPE